MTVRGWSKVTLSPALVAALIVLPFCGYVAGRELGRQEGGGPYQTAWCTESEIFAGLTFTRPGTGEDRTFTEVVGTLRAPADAVFLLFRPFWLDVFDSYDHVLRGLPRNGVVRFAVPDALVPSRFGDAVPQGWEYHWIVRSGDDLCLSGILEYFYHDSGARTFSPPSEHGGGSS